MDDEERKQADRSVPFSDPDQVHSDFAIAVALQEQERAAFNILTSIGSASEEESEEDYSSEEEINENDYEFSESQEMDFLEGQDSNSDSQDMDVDEEEEEEEEDDIDPDELSYEELIALGESVGEERRGLTLEEISKCLRPCKNEFTEKRSSEIDRLLNLVVPRRTLY
ncbi:hypothetical protein GH714_001345 [Hevea brasiliensis]|uniref:Uncharacterized protein n=1 Tax=Hevea brasiliensis TaxID=3981 RepID=A0A6A6L9D3_HEVBR|nr:hypothetical protein GH714_001345 [Hevea brasiliensis]